MGCRRPVHGRFGKLGLIDVAHQLAVDEPEARRWQERAACRGMDTNLFFPVRGEKVAEEVEAACDSCSVRRECGEAGLREFGIWGGLSERARRRTRRRPVATRGPVSSGRRPEGDRSPERDAGDSTPQLEVLILPRPDLVPASEPSQRPSDDIHESDAPVCELELVPEPDREPRTATACRLCGNRLRGREYCDWVCEAADARRRMEPDTP